MSDTPESKDSKHKVIFATAEDHKTPSKIILPDPEEPPGILLPNGEINWACPCLGGMATGPCGVEFRNAFSCFQYSTSNPKGSDCYETFKTMQECMQNYPTVYGLKQDEEEDDEFGETEIEEKYSKILDTPEHDLPIPEFKQTSYGELEDLEDKKTMESILSAAEKGSEDRDAVTMDADVPDEDTELTNSRGSGDKETESSTSGVEEVERMEGSGDYTEAQESTSNSKGKATEEAGGQEEFIKS